MSTHSEHLAAIGRLQHHLPVGQRLLVGIDTVRIGEVQASLDSLGERFAQRLFTQAEQSYADQAPSRRAERLAARFAAKEAALKAFGLTEAGIDWHEIEVCRAGDGQPSLALHGKAGRIVGELGAIETVLSLSHDGDQACAIVLALAPSVPLSDTLPPHVPFTHLTIATP